MKIHSRGKYKAVIIPSHPYADKRGRVGLHRYIVEQKIGRYLLPTEVIHHIDGNVDNNDPLNLEITNSSEHSRKHHSTGISYVFLICEKCKIEFKREKRNVHEGKQFCSEICRNFYFSSHMPEGNHEKKGIIHGTYGGYRRGCRCDNCKKIQNERIKKYRDKKKLETYRSVA